MKKEKYMSWDTYFMSVALLSSFRSKDNKTQNGACIIDPSKKIIGIGYNGLPSGCSDDDPIYWKDEDDANVLETKHTYVVHAEKNAIYNCMAHNMTGASIYTTQYPCNTCAQAIIQVGIKEVIFLRRKEHKPHKLLNIAVNKMFLDAGVSSRCYFEIDIPDINFLNHLESLGHTSFDKLEVD